MCEGKVILMDKHEKINMILDHFIQSEELISSPSKVWRLFVLKHFKKIHSQEWSVNDLLNEMQNNGIDFKYGDTMARYPVIELLQYISELANIKNFQYRLTNGPSYKLLTAEKVGGDRKLTIMDFQNHRIIKCWFNSIDELENKDLKKYLHSIMDSILCGQYDYTNSD